MELTGEKQACKPVNACEEAIRVIRQRRNLKDEGCFDREFLREKLCIWVEEKCVFTEKFP
jgi:hypothetical protein